MNWQQQQWLKRLGSWGLIAFVSIQGYRFYQVGGHRNWFKNARPTIGALYGSVPLIGKPIRQWAYSGGRYYAPSNAIGKRYRGKKSYSRKSYRKTRRGRRR